MMIYKASYVNYRGSHLQQWLWRLVSANHQKIYTKSNSRQRNPLEVWRIWGKSRNFRIELFYIPTFQLGLYGNWWITDTLKRFYDKIRSLTIFPLFFLNKSWIMNYESIFCHRHIHTGIHWEDLRDFEIVMDSSNNESERSENIDA